jgi:hypothetical protein
MAPALLFWCLRAGALRLWCLRRGYLGKRKLAGRDGRAGVEFVGLGPYTLGSYRREARPCCPASGYF